MEQVTEYNCEVWVKTRPLTCQEGLPDGTNRFTEDAAIDLATKKHNLYPNIDYVVRKEFRVQVSNGWKYDHTIIFDTSKP